MPKKKDIWEQITTNLESDISQSEVKTLFSHTTLRDLDQCSAVIEVPNKLIATWLLDNYIDKIKDSFKDTLDFLPEIRFTYPTQSRFSSTSTPPRTKELTSKLIHGLNPFYTFDTFVTAACNRFAYSSALDVAKNPGTQYNPFYVFSKLSLGKTHLLHAIGNHLLSGDQGSKIRCLSVDQFTSEFSLAAKHRKLSQFRNDYINLDLLLLDDVHLLAARKKTQQELISLFNSLYEAKKQIVVAAKTPPSQIHNLLPQLSSRLEWGLLAEIDVYALKTKLKILKKKAEEQNLTIPDDVTFFLSNATHDLKTLNHYLVTLQAHTSLYQHPIDMSTAKSLTKNRYISKTSVRDIQKATAQHFNISVTDLLSNKKSRKFAYPRQMAMYLTRVLTDLSFTDIGKAFGNKDHSTVIYSVKRIDNSKDLKRGVLDDIVTLQNFLSPPLT
jgi:chromosomal replication initiator protein